MSIFILLVISLIILLIIYSVIITTKRPINYPPGPKWWPYFGNTYQLRKLSKLVGGQHLAFEKWCHEYKTPILGLKLGNENVVVGLTYDIVREIHTKDEFIGRPDNFFLRLRTMGTKLGITCTDGPLWIEHRNFTIRHLRQAGYGRLPMELHIQNELNELIDVIKNFHNESIWPGSFLSPSVINVLWALATGKRIHRNDKRLERLLILLQKRSKVFDMCGGWLTQMPWLRYIAPEITGFNLINRFNYELIDFFQEIIHQHKENYTESVANDDLIYAFIKEMLKNEKQSTASNTFTDQQLTMIILDIFIAGSQTTSNTLDLALMMMILKRDIYHNVVQEIQQNFINNTNHQNQNQNQNQNHNHNYDKLKLPYTEAVIMEIQRYFHIVPISGPRRTLRTTTLGEYTIPKNTTILIGLRSVLMDVDYWKDPQIFRPERFLDNQNQIITSEYFLPFGQGKRRCLGDSLARSCLLTFFVGIIKNFHLEHDPNEMMPNINLLPGITLSPKPYKIKFIPR